MTSHAIRFFLVAAVAVLATALLTPYRGAAQDNSHSVAQTDKKIGRWKLRVDPPASGTREYDDRGCGLTVSIRQGINGRGQGYYSSYAAKVDGKEYPRQVRGSSAVNTIAFTQVDSDTVAFTLRENGTEMSTGTTSVSKDGKVLTVTTKGLNATGRGGAEIYDRVP